MTGGSEERWESALDAVVVYARGALCRRLARGTVSPGGRVVVTGLPRSLDPGSLRARVLDTPGVRVTEARVKVDAAPVAPGAAEGLGREVERLRDAREAVEARRDRQLGLVKEIEGLHPVAPGRKREDPHRRSPVEAWLELADFVDERLTGLHARLAELEEELREAEHALTVAAERLARASTDAPAAHVRTEVCAVLTLDGVEDAATHVRVELEYGVPGAVWVPTYRLTHHQGDGSGRLLLRASVAQRTDEDWTGVRIAFSTADLRRRTDLPRLRSVRLGRRQAAPAPSGWREPPAGLADLFAGYDAAGPRPATAFGPGGAVAGAAAADDDWGAPAPVAAGAAAPPPVPPPAPAARARRAAPPMPQAPGGGYGAPQGFAGPPAGLVPSAPAAAARELRRDRGRGLPEAGLRTCRQRQPRRNIRRG
ncbi:DUF4139 domain-containing protein, partial [Streptomyces sp. NPDC051180]|uniref:DUF4140 domain-containing protein n=2 Tax=unclassified Streptomyces TaxID=2593676 RepID=UPI00345002A9